MYDGLRFISRSVLRWFMVVERRCLGEMLSKESRVPSDRRSRTVFGCAEGYASRRELNYDPEL